MREVLGFSPGPVWPCATALLLHVSSHGSKHDSEQIRGRSLFSREKLSLVYRLDRVLAWLKELMGSISMCYFLLCDSLDVKVIEINTITQDKVQEHKRNYTGATISQESFHVLSHFFI